MHQVLEWLRANPAVTTLIVLPLFGALVTWLSKARTAEELAKLPRWLAHVVVVFRIVFPDTRALVAWVAFVLTKQPANLPDIIVSQSLPPPPKGRDQ